MGLSVLLFTDIVASTREDANFTAYVIDDDWLWKIKNLENGGHYVGNKNAIGIHYSYSTHNRFREYLVSLTGNKHLLNSKGEIKWSELPESTPFHALIWFADNEGCLDWDCCKIISADFEKHRDENEKSTDIYFKEKYLEWAEIMKIAAEKNGVVVFR